MRATLAVAILTLLGQSLYSMGSLFYEREVRIRRTFSYGVMDDEEAHVYFLVDCLHFQRPKGIARFPDGGRVRRLSDTTSLYRYTPAGGHLSRLLVLADPNRPGNGVRYSRFEWDDPVLYLVYRSGHGPFRGVDEDPPNLNGLTFTGWDTAREAEAPVSHERMVELARALAGMRLQEGPWNLNEISRYMRALPEDVWENAAQRAH